MNLGALISYLQDTLYPISGDIDVQRVICTGTHKLVPLVEYAEQIVAPTEVSPNVKWTVSIEEEQ